MEPIFLEPVLKHSIWGGTKLRTEFFYQEEGDDLGECWGISAHPNGDCSVKNGEFMGITLSTLWRDHPELFGRSKGQTKDKVFPLLVKIIDAKEDLSIQVHPEDRYALKYENGSLGKTECWYILDCEENAELVLGHHAKSKRELEELLREQRWSDFICKVPVKKGDFIQINPGTVHAITAGITLLETQQNSDITYRVYDYDRLAEGKPRELHIEKSLEVITVPSSSHKDMIIETTKTKKNRLNKLYECDYYKVFEIKVEGSFQAQWKESFLLVSVVEGKGRVNGVEVKKGCHFIMPADQKEATLSGDMKLIASAE